LEKKKRLSEDSFYGYVVSWLEEQGYGKSVLSWRDVPLVPTGARLGIETIRPDVAAYKKDGSMDSLLLVEVKADPMYIIEGIGRCIIYKLIANYVYLALPSKIAYKIGSKSFYQLWGVGVLSISDEGIIEEKVKPEKNYPPESEYKLRDSYLETIKSSLGIV
jgi:hypothetical protein